MAVLACSSSNSNKENVPPPHGVAVKSHRMKRPGAGGIKTRRRAPLRDITNLFPAPQSPSTAGTSAVVPVRPREEPTPLPEVARGGAFGVVAMERRSLRKEFR